MATKTGTKPTMYLVIPRNNETLKEGFAVCGTKRVPFDSPVPLSDKDVESLKRQREPIQIEKQVSVREIMQKHQVDQNKANQMARMIQENPDQGGKSIEFVSKYIVTPA